VAEKFIRKVEDFTCHHCGVFVVGNGYTNHCPACLWSLHVDINPGDRASDCGGDMEPISLIHEHGEFVLTHKCLVCGHQKSNKTLGGDRLDEYLSGMI
jgi:transcription elongation factor Elf1